MAIAELARHGAEGRVIRVHIKQVRTKLAETEADAQIKAYFGEPSAGLFAPSKKNLETQSNVVFLEDVVHERKSDDSKKRPEVINPMLAKPPSFSPNNRNESFIRRVFPRLPRFAITLDHKGKLDPIWKRFLGV